MICFIGHVAIPGDTEAPLKEAEELEQWSDLRREFQKLWKVKTKVVPVVLFFFCLSILIIIDN